MAQSGFFNTLFDNGCHILQRGSNTDDHDIFVNIELGIVVGSTCALFRIVYAQMRCWGLPCRTSS